MARRGHTSNGRTYCSECGSGVDAGVPRCEHCGESLEHDFQAVICPYCTTIVASDSPACTNCGLRFTTEREKRSKEDEEFLSRLLEWGKNLEAKRHQEDKVETEKAATVFKDVVGAMAPTPLQEETLREIKKSAEERAEFEKREESIVNISEPLKRALEVRKNALNDLEGRFKTLQAELQNLSPEDLDSDRKRQDIERQLSEILEERKAIQNLEENINNMDMAYRQLLKQHSGELKEKEDALNARLDAFKKEMERREKEKERLKAREDFLEKKDKEMEARIEFLRSREAQFKEMEEQMRQEIAELRAEKDGVSELRVPAAEMIMTSGKWVIDSEELADILRKSKKIRDDWLEEQKKIQESIFKGETPESIAIDSQERLDQRERELQKRIGELEKKLAETVSEDRGLRDQEKAIAGDMKRLKKVLKVLDDLLENLPDDVVERFANSKDYKEYDELMQELGL